MTTIPSARFSKSNWLELHLKHCSFLTNGKCGTILIKDSIVAGLIRYQNMWNGNFSFNTLNYGVGGDKVQNVLWQAHNLPAVKSVRMLQSCEVQIISIWIHLKISLMVSSRLGRRLKGFTRVLMFLFAEFIPIDSYWSINRVYIKDVNETLKLKSVRFLFRYIGQNTSWTMAIGSLNPKLFYSVKIHLVERVIQSYLNLYAYAKVLRISMTLEISTFIS